MMTTDRTTKALLLAIALGLWMHVAQDWLHPVVAHAQGLSLTEGHKFDTLAKDVSAIASGTCLNRKLC